MKRAIIPVFCALAGQAAFVSVLWLCTPEPAPPPPVVVLPPPNPAETAEEIRARKQLFIELLLPIIRAENKRLLAERERLNRIEAELAENDEISRDDFAWLKDLATEYDLDPAQRRNSEFFRSLRRRIDIVPAGLIIAQAALESGWGRSRVTRESNSFFGEYCYGNGCGVPAPGIGDLRAFATPADSVRAYMHNLNSNKAYAKLRRERERLRAAGGQVTGLALATSLGAYSERGDAYVADVLALIRTNDLDTLPSL